MDTNNPAGILLIVVVYSSTDVYTGNQRDHEDKSKEGEAVAVTGACIPYKINRDDKYVKKYSWTVKEGHLL